MCERCPSLLLCYKKKKLRLVAVCNSYCLFRLSLAIFLFMGHSVRWALAGPGVATPLMI